MSEEQLCNLTTRPRYLQIVQGTRKKDNNTQKNINTYTDTNYSNKSFWVPSLLVIARSMFLYIELLDIVIHKKLKKKTLNKWKSNCK